jgi:hypothetical protein
MRQLVYGNRPRIRVQHMSEGVLIAVVSGGFSIVVALIMLLGRSNKREHEENGGKLDILIKGQERVESKIDGHIGDHARGDV